MMIAVNTADRLGGFNPMESKTLKYILDGLRKDLCNYIVTEEFTAMTNETSLIPSESVNVVDSDKLLEFVNSLFDEIN